MSAWERVMDIKEAVKTAYGIAAGSVTRERGGWSALAYKVSTAGADYFLKVYEKSRASTRRLTATIDFYVPVTMWLERHSALHGRLPVPVLTKDGSHKYEDEYGVYLLYEYIDGSPIRAGAWPEERVLQFCDMLTALHSVETGAVGIDLSPIREDFDVSFLASLESALFGEFRTLESWIRDCICRHADELKSQMARLSLLAERLREAKLPMTLCHTDLHRGNLMEKDGNLFLLDWENLSIAPREADMMCICDESYFPQFMRAYGQADPDFQMDREALEYYQIRRRLFDILEFMEQLLQDKQEEDARRQTVRGLMEVLAENTDF